MEWMIGWYQDFAVVKLSMRELVLDAAVDYTTNGMAPPRLPFSPSPPGILRLLMRDKHGRPLPLLALAMPVPPF